MTEYSNLKIKDWALEDRPREKLIKKTLYAKDEFLQKYLVGNARHNHLLKLFNFYNGEKYAKN